MYACCTETEASSKYGEWIIKKNTREQKFCMVEKKPNQWKRMRERVRENTSQKHRRREADGVCVHSCKCLSFLVFLAKSKRLISYKSKLQNPGSIRESQTSDSSKGFWSGPDPFKALTRLSRGDRSVGPTSKHPKIQHWPD